MLEKAQEPNDQLPIWAGASEIATFEEGGNQMDKMFHAHNLKNVINSNKNSIIDRFYKNNLCTSNFIRIEKYKQVLKNYATIKILVNIFVKSYTHCFPIYFALNKMFGPLFMSFPLCGMLSCLLP